MKHFYKICDRIEKVSYLIKILRRFKMENNIDALKAMAKTIRKDIVETVSANGSGHPGGSLSSVEILTTLYFKEMNLDPKNPTDPDRDRFVLSKGHAAPLLYSVLARKGYFNVDELKGFRKFGAMLQGHPDMKGVPGVDMSTGSLAQGFSAAVGMALVGKLDKKEYRTYVLLGDGELEEGQAWEAAMSAGHYKLDNFTAFVDLNGLQIDGTCEQVMNVNPVPEKFAAFGWNVVVVEDGHSFEQIIDAVNKAKEFKGKPTAIVCKTVKGKGISFMENKVEWHAGALNKEQLAKAFAEIDLQ